MGCTLETGIEPNNEGSGSVRFDHCCSSVRVRLILSSGSVLFGYCCSSGSVRFPSLVTLSFPCPYDSARRRLVLLDHLFYIKLIHTATLDTTKLSRLCRVRFGGVNWIPDNPRLSPTENLKSEHVDSNCPIHTATPDTTETGLSRRVWWAV